MSNYNSIRRNSCLCFEILNKNENIPVDTDRAGKEPKGSTGELLEYKRKTSQDSENSLQATKSYYQSLDSLINLEGSIYGENTVIDSPQHGNFNEALFFLFHLTIRFSN